MNYALIDVGSNTVKTDIYSVDGGEVRLIYNKSRYSHLGSHIRNGSLDADGLAELISAVIEFRDTARERSCVEVFCFATAALRRLNDFGSLHTAVLKTTGVDIDLIDGRREAKLSFLGMLAEQPDISEGMMLDMGGGSTESVVFADRKVVSAVSLPFGCLSLADTFAPENDFTDGSESNIFLYVNKILDECGQNASSETAIIVGGTSRAACKLNKVIYGGCKDMIIPEFKRLYEHLKTVKGRASMYELIPKRAPTVLPGLAAYSVLFDRAGVNNVIISDGGIRRGYLFDKFGV